METIIRATVCGCLWIALGLGATICHAQDPRPPVDEDGRVIDFQRDIMPIFTEHCYECHSGDDAKADFHIDDRDAVLGYVEPEDPEGSMLYFDYLLSPDVDMMMPPVSHGGPLTPSELALVSLWIQEGADWPETAKVSAPAGEVAAAVVAVAPAESQATQSFGRRLWAFQGYFHPAMVHFPIALLTIGGLFVVLGIKWPKVGTQVPLACLLLGSISAVAASVMGWSFAFEKGYPGYGAGWSHDINPHRWSGTVVAVAAILLAVIALIGVSTENKALNRVWKFGLFALALSVGLVGHQGGELTYGKSFYPRAFQRLWGTVEKTEHAVEKAITGAISEQ